MNDTAGAVLLAGRVVFASYFAYYGLGHLRGRRGFVEHARAAGRLPIPALAGWPAGLWLWGGALAVALGVWPEIGALMLALFVTLTIVYVHHFWSLAPDAGREAQRQLFLRNVALVAALAALFATFAGLGDQAPFVLVPPVVTL